MDHHPAMIAREFALEHLQQVLAENPVGALLGPRQCGKSTLAGELAEQYETHHWFDLERADDRAALRSGLAPRVLRLDPTLPIGFPRDLDILPNTLPPEQHRGYAVQWFGLALAVLATSFILGFRRKKP